MSVKTIRRELENFERTCVKLGCRGSKNNLSSVEMVSGELRNH